ncbi:MAG: flagellin [Rickettsiales bacterium]|nr:flagellin [Rickettsiales bacterium]|tara:strand:- start:2776 stop:4338 length:1563 start_codon:yes stop_codon:yes gene_type:complete
MPGINTSMGTSASMKSLLKTEREMLSAMERISSGKRINNAGDDAAGAAISDRMTATIRALDMSIRNAADVLSMAQVAEGALDEHSQALQRIRELSIQAATDILNSEQRIYLQTEANQLLDEMDRVARDTTFNEIAVLDGTFADRRFQIGSHEREKAVISVANLRTENLGAYQSETDVLDAGTPNSLAAEGTTGATAAGINSLIDADDDLTITGLVGTATIDIADNNTAKEVANLVNASFDSTGVSATATTTVKIEMLSTDASGSHVVGFNLYGKNATAQAISATVTLGTTAATSDLTNLRDAINSYSSNTGIRATLNANKNNIIIVQDEGEDVVIENLDFSSVADSVNTRMLTTSMNMDQDVSGTQRQVLDTDHDSGNSDSIRYAGQIKFHSSQTFTIVGNTGGGLYEASPGTASLNKVSTIDIRTVTGAVDALKVIDRALDRIHMERAKFGAIMSRMNVVIDNLTNVSQNQRASRARIVDADFAQESARLSKSQILQQSAMNMVAQASRTMQNVLVLFQ